jgi:hypothetical protein
VKLYETGAPEWYDARDRDDLRRILLLVDYESYEADEARELPDDELLGVSMQRAQVRTTGEYHPPGATVESRELHGLEWDCVVTTSARAWAEWAIARGDDYESRLVSTTQW